MKSVVMIGATGAVGGHVVRTLCGMPDVVRLTLLGRRPVVGLQGDTVTQKIVDVSDPESYEPELRGHDVAICTLGVGEPSKVSRGEFVRVDKTFVLGFAASCRRVGVTHFEILGSVGANPRSRSFYLRTKGELEEALMALGFEHLSIFRPSMILTPTNRYGVAQAVTLAVWPRLDPLLVGPLRKYRGIPVDVLGRAIALNLRSPVVSVEVLQWAEIKTIASGRATVQ
jgi:uncharacterized protein YbjT (DUF2867 family)